jgi:microcystin-dependent protein
MNQYLGEVRLFAGNFAPKGWALCNGQLLPIQQYSALFAILGTNYGGNGTQNFGLPDLRSRVPLHWGHGPSLPAYVIGELTGTENAALLNTNLPMHTHSVKAVSAIGNQTSPVDFYPASGTDPVSGDNLNNFSDVASNVTLNPVTVSMAGGSTPTPILQPLLTVTFIIALVGIFPSRN